MHFDTYWKGPRNQNQLEDFRQFCYWFRQDNIHITAWTKYFSLVNKCLVLNLEIEKNIIWPELVGRDMPRKLMTRMNNWTRDGAHKPKLPD